MENLSQHNSRWACFVFLVILCVGAPGAMTSSHGLTHPPYLEIPMSAKLVVAEKVYRELGLTADEFWNHFYRVVGYHLETAAADEARRKSIALTERMLGDTANAGQRKELLYVLGAMRHFIGDDPMALKAFEEAAKLKYESKALNSEENKNYNQYLSQLIKEYSEMIHKGEGPRQKGLK